MLRRRQFLALATGFVLAGCSSFVPEGATAPGQITRDLVLGKINEVRAANGRKPLTYNTALEAASRRQAELMAQHDELSHDLGETLRERVRAAGYVGAVGENLAAGQKTLELAIEGWLNSPGHRSTMLEEKFSEVGLAVITRKGTKWGTFWATIYGGDTNLWLGAPRT